MNTENKYCKNCFTDASRCFILVDECLDKYGYCADCFTHSHSTPKTTIDGFPIDVFQSYIVKEIQPNSFFAHLYLKTHSFFKMAIVLIDNPKIFVAIEGRSCFTFADIKHLLNPSDQKYYISEKLCIPIVDAHEVSVFFELFQTKIEEYAFIVW